MGLEVLYWLPFLERLRADLNIPPERIIPISRGGASVWYRVPTGLELYALRELKDIRIENRLQVSETGSLKQTHVRPFDRAILKDAAKSLNLTRYRTVHPAWLYQTLAPFWHAQRGLNWVYPRLAFSGFAVPPLPEGVKLPESFVAMKFYARSTWPANPQTATVAREIVKQVSQAIPVVLLHTDVHADDHVDCPIPEMPNVYRLSDLSTLNPMTSLATISAVLAKAHGFVGTYGGLSHLALRLFRPSLSVYTEWQGALLPHKHLCESLAIHAGLPYHVLKIADIPMLQDVLPRIVTQATQASSSPQSIAGPLVQQA